MASLVMLFKGTRWQHLWAEPVHDFFKHAVEFSGILALFFAASLTESWLGFLSFWLVVWCLLVVDDAFYLLDEGVVVLSWLRVFSWRGISLLTELENAVQDLLVLSIELAILDEIEHWQEYFNTHLNTHNVTRVEHKVDQKDESSPQVRLHVRIFWEVNDVLHYLHANEYLRLHHFRLVRVTMLLHL